MTYFNEVGKAVQILKVRGFKVEYFYNAFVVKGCNYEDVWHNMSKSEVLELARQNDIMPYHRWIDKLNRLLYDV